MGRTRNNKFAQLMNHDIMHCKGIGRPIKHGCLRYEAHTKAGESDKQYLPYATEMYDHGTCPIYVRTSRVPR